MKTFVNKITLILLISLILLSIVQIGTRVFHNQLHYDEAYNLQIPLNLHNHGIYESFDGLLDTNITTGPTVLLPAALLYNASHPMLPRLITALYSMIILTFVLAKFLSGRLEKIIYLILINITPLFFLFSAVVLGEIPGFVFLFFSYVAFTRLNFFVAGTLLALSILTKTNYIIGVIPFLIYSFYSSFIREDDKPYFKKFFLFIVGFVLPIATWELYKLSAFHFDFKRYLDYTTNLISFTRSHGHIQIDSIEKRFAMIGYTLHVGGALFIFIMLFVSSFSFMKNKNRVMRMLSIFTFFYTIHFICFGATDWYRHFFPAMLSLLIIVPSFLKTFFTSMTLDRKLLSGILVVMLLISILDYKYRDKNEIFERLLIDQDLLFLDQSHVPYIHEKKILTDQYDMAEYIKKNIKITDKISGFKWLNSPEIAYLSGRKIHRDPEDGEINYILSSIYDQLLDPEAKKIMNQFNLIQIYSNDSYVLYKKNNNFFSELL